MDEAGGAAARARRRTHARGCEKFALLSLFSAPDAQ